MFMDQKMDRMFLKLKHSTKAILVKTFFVEIEKLILKLRWKYKRFSIKTTLKNSKAGGLALPDFKAYCKATYS